MKRYFYVLIFLLVSILNCSNVYSQLISVNNDEFDNSNSLAEWKFLHEEDRLPNKIRTIDINKSSKEGLYIEPFTACWYSGFYGIYMYKEISNDFIITTKIKVTGIENDLPADKWSIAGLLIRKPIDSTISLTKRKENWLYINSGRGKEAEWVLDSKYTIDNESTWYASASKNSLVELRIVRIKSFFVTMYKLENEDWKVHKKMVLNNIPENVQAGINISANASFAFSKSFVDFNSESYKDIIPDMKVYVDYIRFNTPFASEELQELLNNNDSENIPENMIIKDFCK
ncbi:MAG: hypothetical protein GY756_12935 [bacterium]|nr:hypothetical protein [bacterium]